MNKKTEIIRKKEFDQLVYNIVALPDKISHSDKLWKWMKTVIEYDANVILNESINICRDELSFIDKHVFKKKRKKYNSVKMIVSKLYELKNKWIKGDIL